MRIHDTVQNILASYLPLPLEKAERVKLMRRMDTKYIIQTEDMISLLRDVKQDYHILEIASQRTGVYNSVYYDTTDSRMFRSHVTGRFPRYKVRERHYSQNGLKFVEIKQKNSSGCTSKRRISLEENEHSFIANGRIINPGCPTGGKTSDWLSQQTPFKANELLPALIIRFERITLINNEQTERVTLDFNLQYCTISGVETPVYERVAIVEIKQEKTTGSPIKNYLRSRGIRPCSFSKFCTGMFLTGRETGYKKYKPNYSRFIKNAT